MPYQWIDHTAELELQVEADTQDAVFGDALAALAELLSGDEAGEPMLFEVSVDGPDPATLLAAWLDELVFRAETGDLVPEGVERLSLGENHLDATVRARRGRPPHLVKGVTYHRLAFEPHGDGYRATVILDV